jgi:hypothetical protein
MHNRSIKRMKIQPASEAHSGHSPAHRWLLVASWSAIAALCLLRFFFLTADFPNHSPWIIDQAKFTDEGWWASGAISHHLFGRWTVPGDYNPVVVLPVWPAMLALLFHFTGVSLVATLALNVAFSIATLGIVFVLVRRYASLRPEASSILCVLFLAASPFAFAYSRLATLDTFVLFEFCLLMLLASSAASSRLVLFAALPLAVTTMMLTKTTAVVFLPAIVWLVWKTLGGKLSGFFRACLTVGVVPAILLKLYLIFIFHRGFGPDYNCFFFENSVSGIDWAITIPVIEGIFRGCLWIDRILYPMAGVALMVSLVWNRKLWRNPLFSASWIALAGQAAFLFYRQGALAPRYVLVLLVPMVLIVGLAVESLTHRIVRDSALLAIAVAVALNVAMIASFVHHRRYEFFDAAQSMRAIVERDPSHNKLILGISAANISLMTGIPSINDYYGSQDLAVKARRYQPGWYQVWMGIDPDLVDELSAFRIEEVARYRAFDNYDRVDLILYRLTPRDAPKQTTAPDRK